jgi:hypothetical protein
MRQRRGCGVERVIYDLTEKIVVAVRQRRGCGVERVVAVKQRQGTGGRMDVGYGVLCVKHGGGRK